MEAENELATLVRRIEVLEAEAAIRRVQARYMLLCDTPCPEPDVADDAERIERILELYTDDAVWEGVGEAYTGQFGRAVGKDAIRDHFRRFWDFPEGTARLVLNAHYLTTEHIVVTGDEAAGHWIHLQPWLYDDGTALLRSSRLHNRFRRDGDDWKITRTRTENVFVADLPAAFARTYPSASIVLQE
ncbi:nuclear transport factor 2 family protein [Microbacterium gorillae]|uniref:nuclear transport factor 2 family protein n=1 Tax=Microbacterium gorillae TaxID=1231063 RepID=UPI00058F7B67|nr:nuclear transport factor 2 family protein [Microbacterium gorillae]